VLTIVVIYHKINLLTSVDALNDEPLNLIILRQI